MTSLEQQIVDLEQKLHALDAERTILAQTLAKLRQQRLEQMENFAHCVAGATVTHQSSRQDKISCFAHFLKAARTSIPSDSKAAKPENPVTRLFV